MFFYHSHTFGCVLAIFKISGHVHHICVFRVLNRFVQLVIQLVKTFDWPINYFIFITVGSMDITDYPYLHC
jgi:hypothetical protein